MLWMLQRVIFVTFAFVRLNINYYNIFFYKGWVKMLGRGGRGGSGWVRMLWRGEEFNYNDESYEVMIKIRTKFEGQGWILILIQ